MHFYAPRRLELRVCLVVFLQDSHIRRIFCSTFLSSNMKPQYFVLDLILLCMSCGASALATSIPAVPANLTSPGAAHSYGTDTSAISKSRRKRYISQNDMLAILDYHNKVRGKVFPPASNMEYMVSESISKSFPFMHDISGDVSVMLFLFLICVEIFSCEFSSAEKIHLSKMICHISDVYCMDGCNLIRK